MQVEIITSDRELNLYGFSGVASNKDYAGTAFKLMDRMWQIVKAGGLKNKGLNIWVYEPRDSVFAGVELYDVPENDYGLENKKVTLSNYAYYKHIGPYSQIKEAGMQMRNQLLQLGNQVGDLYIEIYGHWTNDESKLETELLMSIE